MQLFQTGQRIVIGVMHGDDERTQWWPAACWPIGSQGEIPTQQLSHCKVGAWPANWQQLVKAGGEQLCKSCGTRVAQQLGQAPG
jgi:hypothetical protein